MENTIHEGDLLRDWLKMNGLKMEDIWKSLQYKGRQSLNFHLAKPILSTTFKDSMELSYGFNVDAVLADLKGRNKYPLNHYQKVKPDNKTTRNVSEERVEYIPEFDKWRDAIPGATFTLAEEIEIKVISTTLACLLIENNKGAIERDRAYRIAQCRADAQEYYRQSKESPFVINN